MSTRATRAPRSISTSARLPPRPPPAPVIRTTLPASEKTIVSEVLMTHPAVSLARVVGVPHDAHGEDVKAFIIVDSGTTVTSEEIIAWSKEQMAAYKYPRIIEIVDSLPMTATGEILKRGLK